MKEVCNFDMSHPVIYLFFQWHSQMMQREEENQHQINKKSLFKIIVKMIAGR